MMRIVMAILMTALISGHLFASPRSLLSGEISTEGIGISTLEGLTPIGKNFVLGVEVDAGVDGIYQMEEIGFLMKSRLSGVYSFNNHVWLKLGAGLGFRMIAMSSEWGSEEEMPALLDLFSVKPCVEFSVPIWFTSCYVEPFVRWEERFAFGLRVGLSVKTWRPLESL
jgi:hypothetical protein